MLSSSTFGLLAVRYVRFTLVKDLHTEFSPLTVEVGRILRKGQAEADRSFKGAQWQSGSRISGKTIRGQDVAEYAVMLAVILVIVVGTIRLIGSNANNVFSSVGSAIQ